MKTITLTQGVITWVDDADFDAVSKHPWYAVRHGRRWVAVREILTEKGGRQEYMHRVILKAPLGTCVDHIHHHPLETKIIDNRKENLRLCSIAQNQRNQRKQKGCSSCFKGVCWHRRAGAWMAQLGISNKSKYLGLFSSEEEAARAYDAAAKEQHGEFARLNFPNDRDNKCR